MNAEVHMLNAIMYSLDHIKKNMQISTNFICHCARNITREMVVHT